MECKVGSAMEALGNMGGGGYLGERGASSFGIACKAGGGMQWSRGAGKNSPPPTHPTPALNTENNIRFTIAHC